MAAFFTRTTIYLSLSVGACVMAASLAVAMGKADGPKQAGLETEMTQKPDSETADKIADKIADKTTNKPGPELASGNTITGRVVGGGVECPQFRLQSGETVSLTRMPPEIENGQVVTLTGSWPMLSKCMQGRTFKVASFKFN